MCRSLMIRFPVYGASTHIFALRGFEKGSVGSLFPKVGEQRTNTSLSGSNRDRSLHIRVNIAVVGECSRRGEGELEGLVLCDIARGTEDPSGITGDCMGSIRGIEPYHLRAHFDRQCRGLEGVLLIRLNDLHSNNSRGWGWSR